MSFDYQSAHEAGYSDSEIASFLGKQAGFDASAAMKSGYSAGEIIPFLANRIAAKKPQQELSDQPMQGDPMGSGMQEMLAQPTGAPGSVLNGYVAQPSDTDARVIGLSASPAPQVDPELNRQAYLRTLASNPELANGSVMFQHGRNLQGIDNVIANHEATVSAARALQPAATPENIAAGMRTELALSAFKTVQGLRMAYADAVGDRQSLEEAKRFTTLADRWSAESTPDLSGGTGLGEMSYHGASGLINSAPIVATGVISPWLALGLFAGQAGTGGYGKYRTRGASVAEAATGGALEGAIMAGTSALPLKFISDKIGKAGIGEFVTGLVARDVPTMVAQGIANDMVDTAIANPNKTWGEFVAEQPQHIAQSVVSAAIFSAGLGVGHSTAKAARTGIEIAHAKLDPSSAFGRAFSEDVGNTDVSNAEQEVAYRTGFTPNPNLATKPDEGIAPRTPIAKLDAATTVDDAIRAAQRDVAPDAAAPSAEVAPGRTDPVAEVVNAPDLDTAINAAQRAAESPEANLVRSQMEAIRPSSRPTLEQELAQLKAQRESTNVSRAAAVPAEIAGADQRGSPDAARGVADGNGGTVESVPAVAAEPAADRAESGPVPSRVADEALSRAAPAQAPLFSRSSEPFYSALAREVENIPSKAQGAEGWQAQIKGLISKGKVKADEMEWTGLDDWLKLQSGKVTKEQIGEFLKNNGVQVKEVTLGGAGKMPTELETYYRGDEESIPQSAADWLKESERFEKKAKNWQAMPGQDADTRAQAQRFFALGERANEMAERLETDSGKEFGSTKYGNYTLPGGTNYREVLLVLPAEQRDPQALRAARAELAAHEAAYEPKRDYYNQDKEEPTPWALKAQELRAAVASLEKGTAAESKRSGAAGRRDEYRSSHWDEPNVLAHIRLNDHTDATGARVLFVEELQSDWNAEGRKNGFGNKESWAVYDGNDHLIANQPTEEAANRIADEFRRGESPVQRQTGGGGGAATVRRAEDIVRGVPRAPFVEKTDAWLSLALKRIVKMAADEGYDRVAFISGQQSTDRYWSHPVIEGAVGRWNEVTKPQSIRELGEDVLGRKMAAAMALQPVDGGVLAVLKHDQVVKAVVSRIPVDVVDVLAAHNIRPEQLLRNGDVVFDRLPVDDRSRAASAVGSAIRETSTAIRAKLGGLEPGGRDIELLPALKASDLGPRELAGLLDPARLFHRGASDGTEKAASTGSVAEPLAGSEGRKGANEQRAAELASLLNAHAEIIHGREGLLQQGFEVPPSEGMKSFYDKIVPSVANDVLRKLGGGKVGDVKIDLTDYGKRGRDAVDTSWRTAADDRVQPGFDITPAMREKVAGGVPLFKRGENSASGITEPDFHAAISKAFGEGVSQRLIDNGVVIQLKDQSHLPDHVVPFVRSGDTVYGFYDPNTNHTYAVLANLKPEMIHGLVLHEVGVHYGFEAMLGRDKYAQVMNRISVMGRSGNKAVLEARDQARRNAAVESQIPEETLAYLVGNSSQLGVVRETVARIRAFMFNKFGIGGKSLGVDDITALARAAVLHASRTEPGTRTPDFASVSFSRKSGEAEGPDKIADRLGGAYHAYDGVERVPRESQGGVADSIAKVLVPAGRDGATLTAGIIRGNLGEQARGREVAQQRLMEFAKLFDSMPVADNYKFIDAMERGIPLKDAEMNRAAVALRKVLDERRDQVISLGNGKLENFNENYFPHIWKDKTAAAQFFTRRPLEGGKGFLKQRTYDYFSDGLKAGLEPVTTNPVELAMLKAREMDRYIYGQRIFQEMKDNGIAKFVGFGDKPPEGWVKINDKIARVMQYSEQEKGMVLRGEYYAPEQAATLINNHLSPGLSGIAAFDMVRRAGNMMNAAQLGLSAFHLGFTTLDAMISKAALGVKQASRGDIVKGAGNMLQSLNPAQPILNLVKGDRLLKAYMGNLNDPELAPIVEALVQAGGRVKMDDVYRNAAINEFRQAVRKGNYGTAALKVIPRMMDLINKPIFEYLVPRQKLGVFFDMAKDKLEEMPNMTLAAKRVEMGKLWDSVDNRMGELVYDNVFWNRALKDALMVSVRSVGWNLGTFREIGGGVKDIKDIPKIGGLSDRTAYIFGLSFVTSIIGALTQYLYTGEGPKELKDVFFPRTGKIRPDGTEDRLSLPSYMKDIAEYGHDIRNFAKYGDNPFNTLMNKLHPLISTMSQVITNKDFFGGAIRSPGDALAQQGLDEAHYLLKQITPFSLRNYAQQAKLKGEEPSVLGYLTSLQMVGITPAPGYITKNDEEAESSQVNKMREALVTKFREEMRDGADWPEIRARAKDAGLSVQDIEYIRKSVEQRPPKHLKEFGSVSVRK